MTRWALRGFNGLLLLALLLLPGWCLGQETYRERADYTHEYTATGTGSDLCVALKRPPGVNRDIQGLKVNFRCDAACTAKITRNGTLTGGSAVAGQAWGDNSGGAASVSQAQVLEGVTAVTTPTAIVTHSVAANAPTVFDIRSIFLDNRTREGQPDPADRSAAFCANLTGGFTIQVKWLEF